MAEGFYVKVSEKDLPPGSDPHVLIRVVDLQRLTQKVVSAKNVMGGLKQPLVYLTASNELSQKGVTKIAQDVSKKLNLAAQPKKGTEANNAGRKGVSGGRKGKRPEGDHPTEPPPPPRISAKRKGVRAASVSEDDNDTDASDMKRDRKRQKGERGRAEQSQSSTPEPDENVSRVSGSDEDENDEEVDSEDDGVEEKERESKAPDDDDADPYVDYDTKPALAKNSRVVHPVRRRLEGELGVCVMWDIPSTDEVVFEKAIQTAAVDKQLRSLGMPSMEKLWRDNNSGFVEFFEEVVNGTVTGLLREVVKKEAAAKRPVFLRHALVVSSAGLTEEQYVQQQPQPLRTALWYARATFFDFRHDEDARLKVLVSAVAFVKNYLDQIRRGHPELKRSSHQYEEDD